MLVETSSEVHGMTVLAGGNEDGACSYLLASPLLEDKSAHCEILFQKVLSNESTWLFSSVGMSLSR